MQEIPSPLTFLKALASYLIGEPADDCLRLTLKFCAEWDGDYQFDSSPTIVMRERISTDEYFPPDVIVIELCNNNVRLHLNGHVHLVKVPI